MFVPYTTVCKPVISCVLDVCWTTHSLPAMAPLPLPSALNPVVHRLLPLFTTCTIKSYVSQAKHILYTCTVAICIPCFMIKADQQSTKSPPVLTPDLLDHVTTTTDESGRVWRERPKKKKTITLSPMFVVLKYFRWDTFDIFYHLIDCTTLSMCTVLFMFFNVGIMLAASTWFFSYYLRTPYGP